MRNTLLTFPVGRVVVGLHVHKDSPRHAVLSKHSTEIWIILHIDYASDPETTRCITPRLSTLHHEEDDRGDEVLGEDGGEDEVSGEDVDVAVSPQSSRCHEPDLFRGPEATVRKASDKPLTPVLDEAYPRFASTCYADLP